MVGGLPLYISIHALHEESDVGAERVAVLHEISIHALHEESDLRQIPTTRRRHISIHALHEESDQGFGGFVKSAAQFQSTLSMRRATNLNLPEMRQSLNFNPRSP